MNVSVLIVYAAAAIPAAVCAANNDIIYTTTTAVPSNSQNETDIGVGAGTSAASNSNNTALGYDSGRTTTGIGNTGIGAFAGAYVIGAFNAGLGYGASLYVAGSGNTTGSAGAGQKRKRTPVAIQKRRITNVAAGVAPTDAATVGQLTSALSTTQQQLHTLGGGVAMAESGAYDDRAWARAPATSRVWVLSRSASRRQTRAAHPRFALRLR